MDIEKDACKCSSKNACVPVKDLAFTAYSAMSGIIYPLQFSCATANICIIPYVMACDEHKQQVENEIITVWRDDIEPSKAKNYIATNWIMPDCFYIMTDFWNQEWIGCVAVDTKCGLPCITHVLIREQYRKKNLSKCLLMIAEEYVKSLGYDEARLFCKPDMIKYYERFGYRHDPVYTVDCVNADTVSHDTLHVMCKSVGGTHSDTCQIHR